MKTPILLVLVMLAQMSIGQTLIEREVFYKEDHVENSVEKSDDNENLSNEHQTLFSNKNSFGAYIGFTNGFGMYNEEIGYVTSCRLMFVTNHSFGIGFGGKAFVTMPEETPYTGTNTNITETYTMQSGAYGGLYLEPVIQSMKPIHISFPILLGMGGVARTEWDNTSFEENYDYDYDYYNDNIMGGFFLVLEPGAEVEFNIAKWLRIGAGACYRFTSEIEGFDTEDMMPMNGFNYELSIKVGWF